MSLYKNQGQYDRLAEAELHLERELYNWKEAGGELVTLLEAIKDMIDVRVEVALENIRE